MQQRLSGALFTAFGLPLDAVDAHVHPYALKESPGFEGVEKVRPDLARDHLPEEIVDTVQSSGFREAIMVQVNDPHQDGYAEALRFDQIAKSSPVLRHSVVSVDLTLGYKVEPELEKLRALKSVCGLRVISPQDSGVGYYSSPDVLDSLRHIALHSFTYDFLVREQNPGQLDEIARAVDKLGQHGGTFVGDHLLKPMGIKDGRPTLAWRNTLASLAKYPNFFLKISGLPGEVERQWNPECFYPFLDAAFDAFGGNRLIFGSDHPVSYDHAQSVALVMTWLELRGLRASFMSSIFRKNAVKAYRLA